MLLADRAFAFGISSPASQIMGSVKSSSQHSSLYCDVSMHHEEMCITAVDLTDVLVYCRRDAALAAGKGPDPADHRRDRCGGRDVQSHGVHWHRHRRHDHGGAHDHLQHGGRGGRQEWWVAVHHEHIVWAKPRASQTITHTVHIFCDPPRQSQLLRDSQAESQTETGSRSVWLHEVLV